MWSSTKALLIIFSAWCNLFLLMCIFLPSDPHFFDEGLIRSSKTKLLIADRVRDGVVKGILIFKLFPWQLKDRLESDLSLLSTLFIVLIVDLPISSGLGESSNGISLLSEYSSVLLNCRRSSCSVLSLVDSSSASKLGQGTVSIQSGSLYSQTTGLHYLINVLQNIYPASRNWIEQTYDNIIVTYHMTWCKQWKDRLYSPEHRNFSPAVPWEPIWAQQGFLSVSSAALLVQ